MSKRIQSFGILCIVISMALCPFLSVSAVSGTAYSSPYMPVCPNYPTSSQLPFGEDTVVVCQVTPANRHLWYFIDKQESVVSLDGNNSYSNAWTFYVEKDSSNPDYYAKLIIESYSQIIVASEQTDGSVLIYNYGTFQQNSSIANFRYERTGISYTGSVAKFISTDSFMYRGMPIDVAVAGGVVTESNLVSSKLFIASYPDTVKQAIDSISDNSALLSQYYTSLNSKLNSLSIDVQYIQGQNDELSSKVDELQSQLGSQSSEYQSALATAQSQIESNAQSAAQSAADDINNAGEDVSDLDDDMDDVNSIVETLDGWIEDLDTFADTIDASARAVGDALDNASDFVEGFIGACPAIVVALFSFALVFLVVRKIIGR